MGLFGLSTGVTGGRTGAGRGPQQLPAHPQHRSALLRPGGPTSPWLQPIGRGKQPRAQRGGGGEPETTRNSQWGFSSVTNPASSVTKPACRGWETSDLAPKIAGGSEAAPAWEAQFSPAAPTCLCKAEGLRVPTPTPSVGAEPPAPLPYRGPAAGTAGGTPCTVPGEAEGRAGCTRGGRGGGTRGGGGILEHLSRLLFPPSLIGRRSAALSRGNFLSPSLAGGSGG